MALYSLCSVSHLTNYPILQSAKHPPSGRFYLRFEKQKHKAPHVCEASCGNAEPYLELFHTGFRRNFKLYLKI